MFRPGITSITFRGLFPGEIIRLAALAGLEGIEWGADVHAPPGETKLASQLAAQTRDMGLCVSSYGSYYRAGYEEADVFPRVLDSAVAMGAPIVRIWAGKQGSNETSAEHRRLVEQDCLRISEMAHRGGVKIACEWHGGTLTDTADSAGLLFQAVEHPAFCTYWQPRTGQTTELCLSDMNAAMGRLVGLHVFAWAEDGARLPLRAGESAWKRYLAKASAAGDMFAMLEFVAGDDPQQMLSDAATLRGWLVGQ